MTLERGAIVELVIEDLTVEGGGVARLEQAGQAGSSGPADMAGPPAGSRRVVFTDRGLPGERVRARIETLKSRFAKAVVLESLAPSPAAVPSHCPYALSGGEGCGGCVWPGLDYTAELAWKDNQVRQTLRRVGGVSPALLDDPACFAPILPSPAPLGYRNKMEFAFAPNSKGVANSASSGDSAGPALGLRRRALHGVLEVEDCPLAAFPVKEILRRVREWALRENLPAWDAGRGSAGRDADARKPGGGREGRPAKERAAGRGFLRHLVLRRKGESCIAELITAPCGADSGRAQAVRRLAAILCPEAQEANDGAGAAPCRGFIHSLRSDAAMVAYGESRLLERGDTVMEECLAGTVLHAPVPAFLQVNSAAASALYALAREYALEALGSGGGAQSMTGKGADAGAGIVDAYCGVGGLALTLALAEEGRGSPEHPVAFSVLGLESDGVAVLAARDNAVRNGVPHVRFQGGDVAVSLAALRETPRLLVADPPRAGLSAAALEELVRLSPEFCLMISCNPATLARDVAALSGSYTVLKGRAVDQFPHTPHVEAVLLLGRRHAESDG